MSFDCLQKRIRSVKSPVVAQLDLRLENLPRQFEIGGEDLSSAVKAVELFGRELIDGLTGVVPAVSFPVSSFELLGWRGMELLEKLIGYAKKRDLFVIADGQRSGLGSAAADYGTAWLGGVQVGATLCPVFDADCLTLNGYLGSDCLSPVLEVCKAADKCALVLVKTPNPSSVELEDMVSGDRQVCTVMGDLTRRLVRDTEGKQHRSPPLGAIVGTLYPVEMKQLRSRLNGVFFLVPCCDTPEAMNIAQYAFDEYGRGAAVCACRPILDACRESTDYAQTAHSAAEELRRRWKQLITIL